MDIFEAVLRNDENELKRLVEVDGVSLKSLTTDDQTAAHLAAKTGNLPLLKYMIDRDSSLLFTKDRWDYTVVHSATRSGASDVVKYLVDERNIDITDEAKNDFGNTILHIAAHTGQLELVKYLIEKKNFPVDIQNQVGEPPLFLAADNVHLNVVKYLVEERKANMTIMDNNDDNILFVSSKRNDVSVPRYLIDEKKVNYNYKWGDCIGDTILHRAAWFDSVDFLRYFIEEKKADLNHRDTFNRTPMHQAVIRGHMASVKFLAEHGANLDITNFIGQKPVNLTKDSRINSYLIEMMSKRNRRSLPKTKVPYWAQEFSLLPEPLIQNVIGVDPTELDHSNCIRTIVPGSSSHIESFLIFVNAYLPFAFGSIKNRRFDHHSETLENIALEVINSESYNFKERV